MPIDTGIYAQIQQPKIDSPIAGLAQMAQLQHLQSQGKLADLTYAEKQREIADQQGVRDALIGAGGDTKAATTALMSKGFYKPALEIGKAQTEQQKQQADIGKTKSDTAKIDHETATHQFELAGQLASSWAQDPTITPQRIQAGLAAAVNSKIVSPEIYQAKIAELQNVGQDPASLNAWAKGTLAQVMKAKDSMALMEADANAKLQAKTSTENNAATNATSSANNAATNETTRRGQDLTNARAKDQLKAPTEFQGKSAGYGARAEQADKIITSLEGNYSPAAINSKVSVEGTPLVGGILGAATNKFALSANDQRAEQAQRDFVNAVLRQESGASISASEFDNARRQYFPQPGDSKDVLTQKAQNRKLAIQGFKNSAGRANFSSDAPIAPAGGDIHAQADAILQGK